jgi:hypothetical protein
MPYITRYYIVGRDCDGVGEILWAPSFDTEEEAQEYVDTKIEFDSDLTEAWVESNDKWYADETEN